MTERGTSVAEEEAVLHDCPRCDALKEQLAEMRQELMNQSRETQQMMAQLLMKIGQDHNNMTAALLDIVKEDRALLKEIIMTRKT